MQEASQPEQKEWKGFLSSMFSSLFWLQENRLTPKNRCPKCNRPKVQTSPFEVRCNCSVLACKESSATPTKQYDDSQDDSSTSKSSINLVYKSSPITSKLSALCNDDSFMKLIIKESTTKCLPTLHNTNNQESSFDDLSIPTCKDSVHICCHLHNDEMVLNTVENDDNTDDNASIDDNDAASNNEDGNDDESTDDSDDKCQANVESYTQTDIVKSGESSCDDSSSDEEKSSAMNLVLNDNSKKIIEILSSKSSTCSSCEHGVVEEYANKSQQEFPKTPSMKCLSSVEQIKDDILLRSSILSSCCDHNFSNENCSSQTDSITYSNNSLVPHPCGTPPEESSQPNITPPSTSNRSAILKPSRIPIHKSRLGSRRNSSRDVSSTATKLVSGSTVTKTVNYQQTLFNENKNIPKKLNRGCAVSTPPMITNVYRSFHLPSQSKPKKASQSYYNVTSGDTGCNTCDEKNSKTINIHQNRHSDTKRRSSIPTFNQKQADNSKLIKSIHHYKDKTNSTNVQTNVDKSPYSKYYDVYPGSQQNNLNDTMIHLQRKPSICSSLLSTDNYMDDETILIIETLIPKDYHVLHHTDKETIINNHNNNNNNTFNTNNSRQSNDKISLRSQKVSRTYSIKSSKPSTPMETLKK